MELRAGKDELKRFNIRTIKDFEKSIGDVFTHTVHVIRYVQPDPDQLNVSRLALHPLWEHVKRHVKSHLMDYTCNASPSVILYVIREQKSKEYMQQTLGHIAGLSICKNINTAKLTHEVLEILRTQLDAIERDYTHPFWKTHVRALERLCFHSVDGELE